MSYLAATFDDNTSDGFRPVNFAGKVTMNVVQYQGGDHGSGTGFLRASTIQAGGSVAVDLTYKQQPPSCITAFAWVRSLNGPLNGIMALWQIGHNLGSSISTQFTADGDWHLINNAIITVPNPPSPITFRFEFYMNTTGVNLDIDTAVLV